jgi:hypothetical protein
MAQTDGIGKVMVEVELADSTRQTGGLFEFIIKVRIVGVEAHACQMVKEAVLLGIQTALGDATDDQADDPPVVPMH